MSNSLCSCGGYTPSLFPCTFLKDAANIVDIIASEAYATIRHILPASLVWLWRKYVTNEIKTISLQITVEKVTKIAYLNIHENGNQHDKEYLPPVLLAHGDYGHPYSMLHLADVAASKGCPVFSVYIPGVENNKQFTLHSLILNLAIDKIENFTKNEYGKFTGVLGVGHSKGAILFAERQFVALDSRVKSTCSIAGRLNIPTETDCHDQILKNIVKSIYQGILDNPLSPLMQIIPKEDWNASYEAMAVRPHADCYTVPGKHLSALYTPETQTCFEAFIANSTS